ncbi:glyoxal oxidase-related protein [Quillaja saponaria]|uniref:Glyoxal oxidase-related protein n=1 Tax=Quillaja saponaria TaxID=32244 RepID=A0AAD7L8W5_QUISA|nr:glyoxal oxidase-related protein [Quillaja saponaria]
MAFKKLSLFFSVFFFFFFLMLSIFVASTSSGFVDLATSFLSTISGGHWVVLQHSVGVSAMHMQVMRNNKVIIFDRTDFGPSNLSLPLGHCRHNVNDTALKVDCTAHSVLYDIALNKIRPLTVHTDTWCSSGGVNPNGTLIQTGGYNDGINKLRTFTPCDDEKCDWTELPETLTDKRWYASNQILPDARFIILGGRYSFTYEFVPKTLINGKTSEKDNYLGFLKETRDPHEENNLYPFLHLLPDGHLFVFANRRSILLDYNRNRILKEYPVIPGEDKRSYPSTGSTALLPLVLTGLGNGTRLPDAEVMICGGSPPGAFTMSDRRRVFLQASKTCGRLKVTDPAPKWVMEEMPMPRVMSDMLILPTGDIIIVNGATNGTAGWEDAANPALNPILYRPNEHPGRRFQVLNPTTIPRMYHSAAVLLPDGRVLVGGSNPHTTYNFTAYPYPTDLSIEAFYPHYLNLEFSHRRPTIITVDTNDDILSYGEMFSVTFSLHVYRLDRGISVTLIAPPFSTHSYGMNQRMLVLDVVRVQQFFPFSFKITSYGPPSSTAAPPGYYMLFIVNAGIPSIAYWVQIK